MKTLTIRVSDEEHALMQAAARKRFMTITGLVRAHFHAIFEADGTLPEQQSAAEPETPEPKRRAIPMTPDGRYADSSAWGAEIERAMRAGETAAEVAASYGMSLDAFKLKLKRYKEEKEYLAEVAQQNQNALTPKPSVPADNQPELVYDPADPENPTEEEQAINAEIARRKLEAMGFKL